MPCANTTSAQRRGSDADHLGRIIGAWLAGRHPEGRDHIAHDGKRRGECVLHAKKNQAGLRRDIEAAFTAAEGGEYSPPHPAAVG